jgi:hypothetical protein
MYHIRMVIQHMGLTTKQMTATRHVKLKVSNIDEDDQNEFAQAEIR